MQIIYTSKFRREYKKLTPEIQEIAERQEDIFRVNPIDPRLKTHKLSGKMYPFWSFSVGYAYRIIFEFGDEDVAYFHSVGTHAIYE